MNDIQRIHRTAEFEGWDVSDDENGYATLRRGGDIIEVVYGRVDGKLVSATRRGDKKTLVIVRVADPEKLRRLWRYLR